MRVATAAAKDYDFCKLLKIDGMYVVSFRNISRLVARLSTDYHSRMLAEQVCSSGVINNHQISTFQPPSHRRGCLQIIFLVPDGVFLYEACLSILKIRLQFYHLSHPSSMRSGACYVSTYIFAYLKMSAAMTETKVSQEEPHKYLDEGLADTEKQHEPAEADEAENTMKRTMTAQDWTGPDDPDNPYNWPFWKKVYNTMAPSFFAFTA